MTDVLGSIGHLPSGVEIERRIKRESEENIGLFLCANRSGLVIVEIYSKGYTESNRMVGSREGFSLSGVSRA